MKRLVTLMVVGAMAALLTSCGQQAPKPSDVKPQATTEPAPHSAAAPAAAPAAPTAPATSTEPATTEPAAPAH